MKTDIPNLYVSRKISVSISYNIIDGLRGTVIQAVLVYRFGLAVS